MKYILTDTLQIKTDYVIQIMIDGIDKKCEINFALTKSFDTDNRILKASYVIDWMYINDDKFYKVFDDDYKYFLEDSWNHNILNEDEIILIEDQINNLDVDLLREILGEEKNLEIKRF